MIRQKTTKKTPRSRKKITIVIICALIVVGGIGAGVFALRDTNNDKSTTKDAKNSAEKRGVNSIDYGPSDESDNDVTEQNKNDPDHSPSTNDGTTTPAPFSATITRVNADKSNKVVQVGTLVEGTSTGTCTLTFSQNGQSDVVKTSKVDLEVNSYTCSVFSVPFSDFPKTGQWQVLLSVQENNKKTTAQWPQAVTIE